MKSLKDRLTANVIIVSVLFFVPLIALNIFYFDRFAREFVESRLEHDIETLLADMELNPTTNKLMLDEERLNPIFRQPLSGHYFRIETDGQVFLSRSLWDSNIPLDKHKLGTTNLQLVPGAPGQSLLLLEGSYRKDGRNVRIAVTEDYAPILRNLKWFSLALGALGTCIIIFLGFMQRLMVTRGLAPLQDVQQDLKRLNKGDVTLLAEDVPSEIQPLVQEINQLLVVAENRIKRSSTAIGNLAHSLKTPLAFLEHVLGKPEARLDPKDQQELQQALEDIRYQLGSELRKARIIGTPTPGMKVLITDHAPPLIAMLKKVYADKALNFRIDIEKGSQFAGDSHDLMELLGNLMDNACKWAKNTVTLQIRQTENKLVIKIADDGPGGTGETFSTLEKRGIRRDESGDGHGLGLSIVREIVDLYRADLDFSQSDELGGLKVTICFPQKPV